MEKRNRIYLLSVVLIILVQVLVYQIINYVDLQADTNLIQRNIETPSKMIFNGYLGLLFGFKYLGNINFLILPLGLIYFFAIKPQLSRGGKMLVVFFLLSFGLIALKGYFNSRYQLTLLPFTLFFVFYFVYEIMMKYYTKTHLIWSYVLLTLFVGYNFYEQVFAVRFKEKLDSVLQVKAEEKPQNKVQVPDVLEYIDSMKTGSSFLVNNLPDFYYKTNKNGSYYWCGDGFFYGKEGKIILFEPSDTDEFIYKRITEDLKCKYIYTYTPYENYNHTFDRFIRQNCTLIATDDENKLLYQINEGEK